MTEPKAVDATTVQRAKGLLAEFNAAGILAAADVHVALRLSSLGGDTSEPVLLATALAVRAVRSGSVCLDLRRLGDIASDDDSDIDASALSWPEVSEIVAALRRSPLVIGGDAGPLRPLRLVDTAEGELLYLDRYYLQERTIRHVLDSRERSRPEVDVDSIRRHLDALFRDPNDPARPSSPPDRQRVSAALAAVRWTTIIAGGPGTGKTHTVARILALLSAVHGPELRIGLAAPTGKAAARLQESVREQADSLGLASEVSAMTLHRLLGWQRGSRSRFRHNATNRLPYDVVIVDETSMVSLTMMCRLLEAVRPDSRLILVGDPDQLTSVDAGAVLADLVARPVAVQSDPILTELVSPDLEATDDPDEAALSDAEHRRLAAGVVRLSRGRRFGGAIAELAVAIRNGDADAALELLHSDTDELSLHGISDLEDVRTGVVESARAVSAAARVGDAATALSAMESHRLLCAHRDGPYGVVQWAEQAMQWVGTATGEQLSAHHWYPGQPLLVTANDHDAKIYNGDTGVIVEQDDGRLLAAFQRGSAPLLIHPSRLSAVQTVYAMTIHRSQGSQYDTVSVLLPADGSALLTRELLYTAITRARKHVRIIGTDSAVRSGVERQVLRASGLRRTAIE